jgi:Secretion system C-terminal sorting domain
MKTFYENLNRKLKSINVILFFLILFSFSSLRTYATIRYVKQTATGLGNGISWANASNNLQAMIDASSPNDEVWVMAGTYKPNSYPAGSGGTTPRDYAFIMRDKVKVYGGFVGTETALSQRTRAVMMANQSILSGDLGVIGDNSDNAYHVVISVEDDNTSLLDGFTITKGNANNDDQFKAILVEFRPIQPNSGGGLYNFYSSIEIRNCNFIDNKTTNAGGGIVNIGSSLKISNCIFYGNQSLYGGGMYSHLSPSITAINCLFSDNKAQLGGGLFCTSSTTTLTNNTFAKNEATSDGGGLYTVLFSTTTLKSCIVWGNKKSDNTESNVIQGKDGVYTVNYSDIEGGYTGTANLNQDPQFINFSDPDGADNIFATADDGLAIKFGSPCVNTGSLSDAPDTDITGFTRFANPDMGAYENRINLSSVVLGAFPSRIICAGQSMTFVGNATVEGITRIYDFKVNGVSKQRSGSLFFSTNNLSNGDSVRVEKIFGDLVFVSNTIVVTIKPLPVTNINSNSPVCLGNLLNLNASGGTEYFWTGPNNYSSTLKNPSFENAISSLSGVYTVKITNDGCETKSTIQVAVYSYQSTLYVKANATGANNGTSWTNAFTDLQNAFDFPCSAYDEIKVAAGTYKPSKDPSGNFLPTNPRDKTFYLPNSKRIYGGFAGNETGYEQRDPIAYPTILSGDIGVVGDNSDNAYHVLITAGSGSGTYLEGFTITKGNANSNQEYVIVVNGKSIHGNTGGGMVNYESSPGFSKCIFTENNSSWEGGGVYNFKGARIFTECVFSKNNAFIGGGMNNTKSSPDIIGCKFIDNYAISGGGGLLNYDSSSPRITHSIFSGNSAGAGGGMYNQVSSSPQVINCTFSTNNAFDGGGMYNWMNSSPTITNCNFSKNSAEKGGGMLNDGASPTIRNCTFYGNSASYYYGGGLYNLTNGTVIVNSIFWGNKKGFATISTSSIEGDPANITFSNIEGGYSGTGNINQDPLFVNQNDIDGDDNIFGTSDDGLELKDGSPCINSGAYLDNSIPDITGSYRAQQGAFDMGAYESPFSFNQCQALTWQQGGVTTCDGKATFTIKVNGLVGNSIAQFSIDKINWFDATSNGNAYTFTVSQQGICRGFYARPKGCMDASKIIWGCYLDTYVGYPVTCEPCSSDLIWIQGGVITCSGKAKMTIKVLGLKANTAAEFSIDNVNWYDATADGNTYTFTVPQQGICRSFWARPKGCTNPAKVIWGCYLDTYVGYPVICTDGQIPTASQAQSLRKTNYSNEFLMSEIDIMSVETMPNPVNDNLTVKIYLPQNTPMKTTLISNIGKEMETKNLEGKAGENTLMIDLKSYKPGMYFLWIQSEELRIIKKVIKID